MAQSMKSHIRELHSRLHMHHSAMRAHYNEMAKCSEGPMAECMSKAAAEHDGLAQYHADCCEDIERATESELTKALDIPGMSAIPTQDAPRSAFLVPRHGAPALNKDVPVGFAEALLKIDE